MRKIINPSTGDDFEQTGLFSEDENASGQASGASPTAMPEGFILDVISGEKRKETAKEAVRQRIAWALFREDGISFDDMEADRPIAIDGRRRKIDIAIFHEGKPHIEKNISRVVVCRPEPALGRTVVRIRDHNQAEKDLKDLKEFMTEIEDCRYGLWTNGLDFFYLEKRATRFEINFEPISYWPTAGESQGTPETASRAVMRRADEAMLRTAFRRCHNFIHGNEGMPKDAAFWQFLYLIFCKIHDERSPRDARQFWIGAKEQFEPQGQKAVRRRILSLFEEVKQRYKGGVFRGNEEITLSDRALAFMVSELSRYDLLRTEVDVKGAAYQEIVGTNLRGDRGQYFTPRGVTKLAVEILAPKENERVFDPACGTGGFLTATLAYMLRAFREEQEGDDSTEEFMEVSQRLSAYAQKYVFGADFDPFLIKACQMNMVMSGDGRGHLYNINSLEFPEGYLDDVKRAVQECNFETVDVLITNPPFGSDIPIDDPVILRQYDLAQRWERLEDGSFRKTGDFRSRVAPEVLFIERCVKWLRPGGRMGIVLPNGILGNPAAEYIRAWILRNTWVLASIDLPVEVFIVDANVNILTSLLFLKRKTSEEMMAEARGGQVEYPIFMAVAEKVGFDRRGNPLYKRHPDGTDIVTMTTITRPVVRQGKEVSHHFTRPERKLDNDLPIIAEEFRAFVDREAQNYVHIRGL